MDAEKAPAASNSTADHHHEASGDVRTTRVTRKRPAPYEVEEDLEYDSLERSSLSDGSMKGDGLRDSMCLCTPAPKIPRPRNAFILYRQHHQSQVIAENPKLSNPDISKIIGQKWKAEREDVKEDWKRLAEEEKQRHQLQYPDYRYQPRRGSRAQGVRLGLSPADDQDRCSKCSGRLISTPRTPATPLDAAALFSRSGDRELQRQLLPNRPMSSHTPYALRLPSMPDVDTWERARDGALPEAKRRRTNGAGEYHSTVDSGDNYRPYNRRLLAGDERDSHAARRVCVPIPASPQREQYLPLRHAQAHMPPPPRPSANVLWAGLRRPGGFDETLRLPPLQTAIPPSPQRTPTVDLRHSQTPTSSSLSSTASKNSPPKSFEAQIMTLPFRRKLEVLARVCNPAPTGRGNPHAETRGAFVAVEGHDSKLVQAVGLAAEKGLRASEHIALQSWAGDISRRHESNEIVAEGGSAHESQVKDMFPSNCFRTMLEWQERVRHISQYITGRSTTEGDAERVEADKETTTEKTRVALVRDGFSLTISDRLACTAPITDAYPVQDHWQWMASLWRGSTGPDLVIYVKASSEEDVSSLGAVEFMKRSGVIIVRGMPGLPLEEATERRLAFEVTEWVREGSFRETACRRGDGS